MSKQNERRIEALRLPCTRENWQIEVVVRYDEGGLSYWDYSQKPKGYYLALHPQELVLRDGRVIGSRMTLGSSAGAFLEPATRFSFKRLKQLADGIASEPKYHEQLAKLLAFHKLELASEVAAVAS